MKKKILVFLIIFLLVLLIDQISKFLVIRFTLLPVYFNSAIAFSLPIPWFLPWIVILIGLAYYFFSSERKQFDTAFMDNLLSDRWLRLALPLIAGGGISNVLDRVFHNGAVVDFIDLRYWPVFNLADSAIVIGVVLIIYHIYTTKGAYYGKP